MLEERELLPVWYGGRTPAVGLRLLAGLYGFLSGLRRLLYAWKLLPRKRLPVPVVVVGNVAVGGTGKTPLVIALVQALRARGFNPGVISRGYAGSAAAPMLVDAQSDPARVGDEARLIFDATNAPVCVARDRHAAGEKLLAAMRVDVILTDDGLQHYKLCRNVEICVIDGERRFGNGRLLPAGPLREPVDRLETFDFRVWNGGVARAGDVTMTLRGDVAVGVADAQQRRPLHTFVVQRVHAVAGIGNPQRFFAQLRAAGIEIIEHAFPDHHPFSASDLDFGDDLDVLMTSKDAVKCRAFAQPRHWQIPVEAELPPAFLDAVAEALKKNRISD
jgi:tetraacyldisaccharide 4'-kinase